MAPVCDFLLASLDETISSTYRQAALIASTSLPVQMGTPQQKKQDTSDHITWQSITALLERDSQCTAEHRTAAVNEHPSWLLHRHSLVSMSTHSEVSAQSFRHEISTGTMGCLHEAVPTESIAGSICRYWSAPDACRLLCNSLSGIPLSA